MVHQLLMEVTHYKLMLFCNHMIVITVPKLTNLDIVNKQLCH